jgi:hypothetical protein
VKLELQNPAPERRVDANSLAACLKACPDANLTYTTD